MSDKPKNSLSFGSILKLEVKQASIYTIATFITQIGSFLVVPLFWQKLSPADYGVIGITEMVASFVNVFLGLQLDASITRLYYEWSPETRKMHVGTIWVAYWVIALSLGACLIYLLSMLSAYLFPSVDFYPFIFLGLVGTVFRSLGNIPYATLRIASKPLLYAFYSLSSFGVAMALSVYYVVILDAGLQGYYVANIISGGFMALLGGVIMFGFATPAFHQPSLWEALKFSVPLTPTSIVAGITNILDRFLLQQFASLEALGIYTVSLKFTNLLLFLHNSLKMSYTPFMVKAVSEDKTRGIENITRMRLFYLVPLFVFATAVSLYIGDFVAFVNRAEYFPVVEWVPWLIGSVLLSTLAIYFAPGLFLAKRTDLTWIPSTARLAVIVLTGILLIPEFQIGGVVVSRYISTIIFLGIYFVLSQRYYLIPTQWPRVMLLFGLLIGSVTISNVYHFDNLVISIIANTVLVGLTSLFCLLIVLDRAMMQQLVKKYILPKRTAI